MIMKNTGILRMALCVLVLVTISLAGGAGENAILFASQNTGNLNIVENDSTFPEASKPGLHVDNKVGFALPYPDEWASVKPIRSEIFRAQPEARYPSVRVWFFPTLAMPLKNLSKMWSTNLKGYSKGEFKTLYDQETKSSSGVVAHETELEWMTNEESSSPNMKINSYFFALKRSTGMLVISVFNNNGPVQEDIKMKVHAIQLKTQEAAS